MRKIPSHTYSPIFDCILPFIICILFVSCSKKEILNKEERFWLEQQENLKVAIYPYYPPYQLLNEQGEVDGVFSEYLELIEEKIGYTFERKYFDTWPDLMEAVRTEKVDMIIEMHPTALRESYLNFYARLFETPHVLVTRNDNNYGKKIKNFYNKTIILPQDYAISENLKQKYPGLKLVAGKDDLTCLKRLSSGEFQGYIGPKAVVHYQIKTQNLTNLKIVAETEFNYSSGIAVFKKNTMLNTIIKKATKNISRDETQAIVDNWLFNIVTPYYQKTKFWAIVSAIVIIVLITILLVNKYLKNIIKSRTKELRIAKENAEESDRLKTNFIRNISHEIRTPMNGIIGFSEFLNNPELTDHERREYTQIIVNSGKQLMSIIEDILEISKLRAKQVKVFSEKTNLINLLDNLYAVFKTKAKDKGIQLILENKLPADQQLIFIDKSKLNKIISNLLDNAIKFTEQGEVKVSSHIKDTLLEIKIEDTGLGIDPKDQKEIFESFSQSQKEIAKNQGGLGLGLTIAKENTMLIGGHLSFVSKVDEGTTFVLTVPYNPIDQEDNIETSESSEIKPEKIEKHIILIAEDGEVNFLFLKMLLNKLPNYDFVIYRAKNGKEAVDICQENKYVDLVLMDIKMPVMDGYEATSKIKELRPGLPIIAQTAYSTEEDIQKALSAGCDDFVSKPVDSKILKPMLIKYFSMLRKTK